MNGVIGCASARAIILRDVGRHGPLGVEHMGSLFRPIFNSRLVRAIPAIDVSLKAEKLLPGVITAIIRCWFDFILLCVRDACSALSHHDVARRRQMTKMSK